MTQDARFLQRGRTEKVAADHTIFNQGDPCSDGDIFYLVSGTVQLESTVQDPNLARVTLRPGAVFGVEEPYGGVRRRMHKARAVSACELYRWNRTSFNEAMGIYQELATQVIRDLSKYLRKVNRVRSGGQE